MLKDPYDCTPINVAGITSCRGVLQKGYDVHRFLAGEGFLLHLFYDLLGHHVQLVFKVLFVPKDFLISLYFL